MVRPRPCRFSMSTSATPSACPPRRLGRHACGRPRGGPRTRSAASTTSLSPESRRRRFLTAGEAPQRSSTRCATPRIRADAMTLVAVAAAGRRRSESSPSAPIRDDADDRRSRVRRGRPLSGQGHRDGAARTAGRASRRPAASAGSRRRRSTRTRRCSTCSATPDSRCGRSPSDGVDRRAARRDAVSGRRRGRSTSATALATVASLRPLLEPKSVAVIGASRDPTQLGRRIFDALMADGFRGAVYPVNPACDEIDGRRCYRSARATCRPASISRSWPCRPPQVLAVVDECGAAGVRSLVVITAGFAETGEAGPRPAAQLVEQGPRLRHAPGRPQLHGRLEHEREACG